MQAGWLRFIRGTEELLCRIAAGISRDRDLPVVSDVVPLPGAPMVLYSKPQNTIYLVGQSDADIARAELALRTVREER